MRRFGRAFGFGWNAFVAGFLYYVGLTAVVLGSADLDLRWMVAVYAAPAALYLGALLRRFVRNGAVRQAAGRKLPAASGELQPALP